GQRYQTATDLIRDLDAILTGPKQSSVKAPETTKKVTSVVAAAKAKRRIRALIHWDLITTLVALSFLSGGLASRGSVFLESWTAKDADFMLRIVLLGVAAVCGAGAVVVYFKELASAGRSAAQALLIALLSLTALTT